MAKRFANPVQLRLQSIGDFELEQLQSFCEELEEPLQSVDDIPDCSELEESEIEEYTSEEKIGDAVQETMQDKYGVVLKYTRKPDSCSILIIAQKKQEQSNFSSVHFLTLLLVSEYWSTMIDQLSEITGLKLNNKFNEDTKLPNEEPKEQTEEPTGAHPGQIAVAQVFIDLVCNKQ